MNLPLETVIAAAAQLAALAGKARADSTPPHELRESSARDAVQAAQRLCTADVRRVAAPLP